MTSRAALCIAALLASCSRVDVANVSAARDFYNQPTSVQQRTFRHHSIDEQLVLYYYGNQVHHPPALYLANCFALNGQPAVELLRSKLKEAHDDLTVRDIAKLLVTIDAMGTYDVAGDATLLELLKSRVAEMRDAGWRDTAQQLVASIGHRRGDGNSAGQECG